MVSKDICSFGIDDLPTPTLVYSKKSGKILCWNKPARKLLGYAIQDKPTVDQWRLKSRTKSKKIDGRIDLGVIPHVRKDGTERLVQVIEKTSTYGGEPCFINWITDVTASVHAEIAYENFYGAVTNASIVSMADRKGIITYVNEKFEKISGYSRKELIGQNHRIINSGHHSKKFWIDMWKTIASGKTWRAEVKNKAKDGSSYWVDTFVMPFLDENGKVEKYLSIRNDITDRKSHEEEIIGLVRQLSEFNYAINNASIVSRADKKGIITYINDNFIRISGYKAEELIGQNHRIINSGFHPKSFWVTMWKTIASGKTWRAEVKNKARNGSYYWVDTFIMPFLDEEGKIKEFLSIRNDITQRKAQEEEIISLNHSLSDFEKAISSSSIVSKADKKGVITYVNENFVKISGYGANELIGQNHRIINSGFHSKDFWVNMWKAIASGKTWRADVKNEAKDGSYYWVDTFIIPFLDKNGKVREFLSIRNDITSRKQTKEELIRANESLSETLVFGKMGSVQLDLPTLQLTVSSELLKLLEETDTAVQTLALQDFVQKYIKPEYMELVQQRVQEGMSGAMRERSTVTAEFEMISAKGKAIWMEAQGIFTGNTAFGILHDITERKEKEQRIIHEREHLNSIINSLPGIFYLFDEQGRFMKWNKNFETISQYSSDEIATMSPLDFFRPDEKELIAKKIGMAFTEGWADVEADFLTKGDYTIPFYFNGVPAFFEGKRCLIGMGIDLSDLRKVESVSLSRLKMIEIMLNGITDGFFATDRELNFTMVNAAFASLAKMTPEEMIGKNILELYPDFKDSRLFDSYQEAIRTQRPITLELKSEVHHSLVFAINVYPNSSGLFVYYKDITDSKMADQSLRKSQAELNAILNASRDSIIYLDRNAIVQVFNKEAEQALKRFGGGDIQTGIDFKLVLPQSMLSNFTCLFKQALGGEFVDIERETFEKDYLPIWTLEKYLPVKGEDGSVIGVSLTISDITERKQADLAIRESNERFKELYNHTPAMMHSMNSEDYLVRVSDYWLQKMGYTREEVIGRKSIEFLTAESRRKAEEEVLPLFYKEGTLTNVEYDWVTKQGKVLNTLVSATGEFDYEGNLIKSLAVITDITEEKKLEQEIEKLAFIAKHTSNAVILCDVNGRITWVNEGFVRITEFTLDEVYGKKPGDFLQGPETNPATIKYMSRCVENGEGFKEEVLNYSKSGKKYWLDIEVMPIRDESNTLKGFMAIESDITQLKLAISEMLNSQSRLQTMMNNAPMEVFMKDLRSRYTFANDAFLNNLKSEKVKAGSTDYDLFPKEVADEYVKKDREVILSGKPITYEDRVGSRYYYTVKFPITDFDGKIYSIGGMSIDITENKVAEREVLKFSWLYEFTSNINQMVIHAESREEILDRACKIATTYGKFKMAWIGFYQDSKIMPTVWHGEEDGYLKEIPPISTLDIPSGRGPTGLAFREGRTVINNDIADVEDKNFDLWREAALKRGYRSSIGVPIVVQNKAMGVFTLYNTEPFFFGENEVKLIETVTDNIGFGIGALEAQNDRKEKTLALIESRDLFRSLVRDINIGILLQGPNTEIILSNASAHNLLGLTESQFHGRSSFSPEWNVIHEDGTTFLSPDFPVPTAIRTKQAVRNVVLGVYRPVTQDRVWLLVDAVPRIDEHGEVKNVISSFIDITQLKKAEKITRESELRFRTILETEPECVKILDAGGRLLEMNKAGLDMIEATDFEQVRNRQMSDLVHEPYQKDFKKLTKEVFEGKTGMMEFKMTGIKGTSRWLETHAVPMRNADGKIVSLLGVTRDVTQRKEVEQKLRDSEERYRKLFELNPAPTWIYDINTLKFLNVNKAAMEHYGYTREDFKEMTVLDIRPEEEKKRFLKAIAELQRKMYEDSTDFPKSWKHKRKDGTIIDVEVMTTALDSSDRVPRLVTVNDVTEKLKVQSKLMNMVQEKEMLIREIHHRVKNNLQLISSILYIRLAKMKQGEMKDFLGEMRQRIKSIAFLHERLLQSGSINHLEMADYLNKLISDIKLSMDNRELKLTINTDVESIWMDLDSAIYCGLIMNELITNSIKYAFLGREKGTINVSLKRVDGKTEFVVADNGVGIQLPIEYNDPNSNFGMQLLDTFSKQLRAEVSIGNTAGTKFKFVF